MAGMAAKSLREIYDHHAWSMDQILARALELPTDRAETPRPGGASLLETLAHIVTAEGYWLTNWQRRERFFRFTPDSIAHVARGWRTLQPETRAFLASLHDADLTGPLHLIGPVGGGRDILGAGILHVLLHGAQHRAEAAAILTEEGHSPGELDYLDYLDAREALTGPRC